jgi:hypothetical protein
VAAHRCRRFELLWRSAARTNCRPASSRPSRSRPHWMRRCSRCCRSGRPIWTSTGAPRRCAALPTVPPLLPIGQQQPLRELFAERHTDPAWLVRVFARLGSARLGNGNVLGEGRRGSARNEQAHSIVAAQWPAAAAATAARCTRGRTHLPRFALGAIARARSESRPQGLARRGLPDPRWGSGARQGRGHRRDRRRGREEEWPDPPGPRPRRDFGTGVHRRFRDSLLPHRRSVRALECDWRGAVRPRWPNQGAAAGPGLGRTVERTSNVAVEP